MLCFVKEKKLPVSRKKEEKNKIIQMNIQKKSFFAEIFCSKFSILNLNSFSEQAQNSRNEKELKIPFLPSYTYTHILLYVLL